MLFNPGQSYNPDRQTPARGSMQMNRAMSPELPHPAGVQHIPGADGHKFPSKSPWPARPGDPANVGVAQARSGHADARMS